MDTKLDKLTKSKDADQSKRDWTSREYSFMTEAEHSKAYRERIKTDPTKIKQYENYLDKAKERQRRYREKKKAEQQQINITLEVLQEENKQVKQQYNDLIDKYNALNSLYWSNQQLEKEDRTLEAVNKLLTMIYRDNKKAIESAESLFIQLLQA